MPVSRPRPCKISALISDVDGTLVTNAKGLTEETLRAVAMLRAHDLPFAIISSRPPRGLRMLLGPLEITTPITGFNGGTLVTPELAVIEQHLVPPDIARCTVEMMEAFGVHVWVFSGQEWYVREPVSPYVELEERTVGFGPTVVKEFGASLDTSAKIVGVSGDFPRLARCEEEIRGKVGSVATVVRSQRYYLDVTHQLANKGAAVMTLANRLAIPMAEIAVIGDGSNDVAMFERAGLSIAMGNADPKVQGAADLITDSNEDEGFAKAVTRFVIRDRAVDAALGDGRSPRATTTGKRVESGSKAAVKALKR